MTGQPIGQGRVVHRGTYGADEQTSTGVLLALEAAGCDLTDEEFAAFDAVDPDALDALFRPATDGDAATTRVTFPVADYQVTVTGDREVVVRER